MSFYTYLFAKDKCYNTGPLFKICKEQVFKGLWFSDFLQEVDKMTFYVDDIFKLLLGMRQVFFKYKPENYLQNLKSAIRNFILLDCSLSALTENGQK